MEKFSEIRDSMAEKFADDKYEIVTKVHEYNNASDLTNGFIAGFDAAIDLHLPVRFSEWKDDNYLKLTTVYMHKHSATQTKTLEELYKHYIENIYIPEQK